MKARSPRKPKPEPDWAAIENAFLHDPWALDAHKSFYLRQNFEVKRQLLTSYKKDSQAMFRKLRKMFYGK